MLTMLTHVYVWGNGEKNACKVLPKALAVPLDFVSKHLGIAPVLTHAAVDLWNWRRIDPNGPLTLSNLATLHTMGMIFSPFLRSGKCLIVFGVVQLAVSVNRGFTW
jgi:hypothetical protein